jgi:HEPN domain-containing protein
MAPETEMVREWVLLSLEDLEAARDLINSTEPRIRVACYLCQQAVEKVLKAYLQLRQPAAPPRTHSLDLLLDFCKQHDPAFAEIRDDCAWLGDFAVAVRYPGFEPQPTVERAKAALAAAESAFDFILDRLPPKAHP